jgi:hypothetical protein
MAAHIDDVGDAVLSHNYQSFGMLLFHYNVRLQDLILSECREKSVTLCNVRGGAGIHDSSLSDEPALVGNAFARHPSSDESTRSNDTVAVRGQVWPSSAASVSAPRCSTSASNSGSIKDGRRSSLPVNCAGRHIGP